MSEPCRFGYVEYDGYQYCFAHFGWHHYVERVQKCDRARAEGEADMRREAAK